MLKNLTVRKRLAIGFGSVVLLLGLVGSIAFQRLNEIDGIAANAVRRSESLNASERHEIDYSHEKILASTKSATTAVGVLVTSAALLGLIVGLLVTHGIGSALTKRIGGLTLTAEHFKAATDQLSAAAESVAQGATEQAAALQETSSSLEEMASMTKQNADSAQQASSLATEVSQHAEIGSQVMDMMTSAIQDIRHSAEHTGKVVKVIDEIAFQTNLLALNAAVEAARAGEAAFSASGGGDVLPD